LKDFQEIIVPNDLAAAKVPEEAILADLVRFGYDQNAAFAVKLALEEAMTNAFRHGNKCDPNKHIKVRYVVTADLIEIEVHDEGPGFEPHAVPDPTQPEYIDRPHGRGIMLMKAYLDEVEYSNSGTSVRLVKRNC
jgi:serine/threonine-protein kinase RsbW